MRDLVVLDSPEYEGPMEKRRKNRQEVEESKRKREEVEEIEEIVRELVNIFPYLPREEARRVLGTNWRSVSAQTALQSAVDEILRNPPRVVLETEREIEAERSQKRQKFEAEREIEADGLRKCQKVEADREIQAACKRIEDVLANVENIVGKNNNEDTLFVNGHSSGKGKEIFVNGGSLGKGEAIVVNGETSGRDGGDLSSETDDFGVRGVFYDRWAIYTLAKDFPLVKMTFLREAFRIFGRCFCKTYRAVRIACRKRKERKNPGKETENEEDVLSGQQLMDWNKAVRGGLKFLKTPRAPGKEPEETCDVFEKEFNAFLKALPKSSDTNNDSAEATLLEEIQSEDIECGCCFSEFPFQNMIQCADGHLFCGQCLQRHVEEMTFGGHVLHGSLQCIDTNGCTESIPFSELRRSLPEVVMKKYEEREAQHAIQEAKLENLVYCPFCSFPLEVDTGLRVLKCQNAECLKASCILCKEPDHTPLRCEEVEKESETAMRRKVEEMMSKAVIRECNSCKAELIKQDGCNKVTCRCGLTMCYLCRRTIPCDYSHFCQHAREPTAPCKYCKKCGLWDQEKTDAAVLSARATALNSVAKEEPVLLTKLVGPPEHLFQIPK